MAQRARQDARVVHGAFDVKGKGENLHISVKREPGFVPEDQLALQKEVYATMGVLKALKEKDIFRRPDEKSYNEFAERLAQAARAGLEGRHVEVKLASEAVEQIRKEIVLRKGRDIKYLYLTRLAGWALCGALIGVVVVLIARRLVPGLTGYGWVVVGSMAGAWLTAASRRREISFDAMPSLLDFRLEPIIRLLFVAVLSVVLGLFLQFKILTLAIGELNFAAFADRAGVALILGVIAGISERALSEKLITKASEVVTPTPS